MFVVTVEFSIKKDCIKAFMIEMMENAQTSLDVEDGCHRFDVCQGSEDASKVFLFEVYIDRAAFDQHLASDHFIRFDKSVSPMIVAKHVNSWVLCRGS